MDINTIDTLVRPSARAEVPDWRRGDAVLAGGTWLFSEPQPDLCRLIDLGSLGWPPHTITEAGLSLSATCTVSALERLELPAAWSAAPLFAQCCRALLGSFKVRNAATVGGNLCLALPAGPMIALCVALDGDCLIWGPDGSERRLPAHDLVRGPQETTLMPGEILRRIDLPTAALTRRSAFRRLSLSPNGRSGALVIGTRDRQGALMLTVTASTRRPVRLTFAAGPAADELRAAIARTISDDLWYDDMHGAPDWRRHVTLLLAEAIRVELFGSATP